MATVHTQRAQIDLFRAVKPDRAVDAVVEQIIDLIQAGRLRDQEVLPGERRLANGDGRQPPHHPRGDRDAAGRRRARRRGGRQRRHARGIDLDARVARRRPRAARRRKLFEALEARRVIEPRSPSSRAARHHPDFDAIRETIDLQRANQSNWWQITQGNVLFHRLLWRAARNPELESAMRSIYRSLSGPLYAVLSHDEDSAPPTRASSCTTRRSRRSCAATPTSSTSHGSPSALPRAALRVHVRARPHPQRAEVPDRRTLSASGGALVYDLRLVYPCEPRRRRGCGRRERVRAPVGGARRAERAGRPADRRQPVSHPPRPPFAVRPPAVPPPRRCT